MQSVQRALVITAVLGCCGLVFGATPGRAQEQVQKQEPSTVQESAQKTPQDKAQDRAQDTVQDQAPAQIAASAPTPAQESQQSTEQKPSLEPAQQPVQEAAQPSTQNAAQNCSGNPDALGTSRLLVIDQAQFSRIGRMQYADSLPLNDKEVVLTFDDGPLPPYSNQVLDILASQCVKVTYFLVGSMARAYPSVVRRIFMEGHTIGTHSEDHPLHFGRLPLDRMRYEIDAGIANVSAALGDPRGVAPFFRVPGLDRSDLLESELAARGLIVFSSDTVADDWHRIKPGQVEALALKRLEARGRGILLLHDIHARTAEALPGLLKELKDKGFHVVQVVPSAPADIEVASKPRSWAIASAMPDRLIADSGTGKPAWPPSLETPAPDDIALPAPDASSFEPDAGLDSDTAEVQWPDRPALSAPPPEPQTTGHGRHFRSRIARHERDTSRTAAREDHGQGHRHVRARGEGHRADATTGLKSLMAMFTPSQPAHH